MITQGTIENIVREYLELSLSSINQPEPRNSEYFDIRGIVSELFEWLKRLPSSTHVKEYKSLINSILRNSEILSNKDRFFRLNIYHLCVYLEQIFETFQKI